MSDEPTTSATARETQSDSRRFSARWRYSIRETQIKLNPTDPHAVQGWLLKKGKAVNKWRARWFVLQGRILRYYRVGDSEPKGELDLAVYGVRECNAINREHCIEFFRRRSPEESSSIPPEPESPYRSGPRPAGQGEQRRFFVCAASRESRTEWIRAVAAVVNEIDDVLERGRSDADPKQTEGRVGHFRTVEAEFQSKESLFRAKSTIDRRDMLVGSPHVDDAHRRGTHLGVPNQSGVRKSASMSDLTQRENRLMPSPSIESAGRLMRLFSAAARSREASIVAAVHDGKVNNDHK